MGSGQSAPFSYDKQLTDDLSNCYSIEVDEKGQVVNQTEEQKGKGCIVNGANSRRRIGHPTTASIPYADENDGKGYTTLWEVFQRGAQKFPQNPCLGTRIHSLSEDSKSYIMNSDKTPNRGKFQWINYSDVDSEARHIGAGLVKLGYKANENVGIFAPNRNEWVIAELALYSQSMRTVALYATLGAEAVEYIINHADTRCIFVSKDNISHLLKCAPKLPNVKHIIQFDVDQRYGNISEIVDEADVKTAAGLNIELIGYSALRSLGSSSTDIFPTLPTADDIAFIMYTSGTTGNPKGAILTHRNIVATVACFPFVFPIKADDRHLSYLPLAHIFETAVQAGFWLHGASIGFFQNNIKRLSEDLCELKPTFLAGVPRVFGRIYQTVFNGVAARNCIVRYVFNKKYNLQCENVRNKRARDAGADQKIFIPLRTRIGLEHCRGIITGAAPCPAYLLEFLRVAIGAEVFQGYGLTETSAALSITAQGDVNVGHTGGPQPCCEVKLVDIPDMDYLSSDKPYPRGEVWCRGPNVFAGYFKDEKATSETIKEGWLATGDVGRWNPNGTLSIIDRKKNMFKLSQGEYVAAERVETEYAKSGLVGQVWVYGNSFKSFLLAVVVPNADLLAEYCRSQGWWQGTADSKIGSDTFADEFNATLTGPNAAAIKQYVRTQLKEQEKPLKGFERVSDIILEGRIDKTGMGFTEANNTLTPTYKLRRPQLLQRYITQLKDSYAKNGEPVGADEKWPGEP